MQVRNLSMSQTVKEKRKKDKDVELKKIDVLDSNFQTWFNTLSSIWIGALIGVLILILTVYYNKQFSSNEMLNAAIAILFIMVAYVALGVWGTRFMSKRSNEHLAYVDTLLDKIEKGETLPSIIELNKGYKKETRGEQK